MHSNNALNFKPSVAPLDQGRRPPWRESQHIAPVNRANFDLRTGAAAADQARDGESARDRRAALPMLRELMHLFVGEVECHTPFATTLTLVIQNHLASRCIRMVSRRSWRGHDTKVASGNYRNPRAIVKSSCFISQRSGWMEDFENHRCCCPGNEPTRHFCLTLFVAEQASGLLTLFSRTPHRYTPYETDTLNRLARNRAGKLLEHLRQTP